MSRALPIADPFCADAAESANEPLAGTAAHALVWILVEEPGVWDRDPIASAGLTEDRAVIEAWLAAIPKSRLQLVRRPRGRSDTSQEASSKRRVMLALPAEGRVLAWTTDTLSSLPIVEAAREGVTPPSVGAERVERPLHLVCTHGKRDRCCALRGMPIYHALEAAGAEVWQTSHLGGHRFAATTVRFPDGYAFGRLTVDDVPKLLDEAIPLDLTRGRVCFDEPTQAADLELRWALALRAPSDVEHRATERTDEGWRVWLLDRELSPPHEHVLDVRRTLIEGSRPKSCGDAPSTIETFVASFDPRAERAEPGGS